MSDFFQNGTVTTFHNLTKRPLDELEWDLVNFSRQKPMGLILPSLFSELEGEALTGILNQLEKVPYLSEIVIGLDRADQKQFDYAKKFFSRLPQPHKILWNDGPRLQAVMQPLIGKGLAPTEPGKGKNVWGCFGYVLASKQAQVVALHDCDILTYEREMLARLLYPVAHPTFNFAFSKGYYARYAEGKMNGRVARLLVTPLLRALETVCGQDELLSYLDSFRYPLAGEFALDVGALQDVRIPGDWGLEIGILAEIRRNFSTRRVCQVEVADRYDHKHQIVSFDDANAGLSRMSQDIAKSLFRKLATRGHQFSRATLRSVRAVYYRTALDQLESYAFDAEMNGLSLDRHQEERVVELFADNISLAGDAFINMEDERPFVPNWNRIASAFPDIFEELKQAVELDNA
ncbi:glycosyl transferase [Thiomicrospira microaerophila]|uniref:glycosyl transferase n=1 Tax=Thiomicrospira microaerophila TaxID=406020 RepID=UPI002010C6FD|nr:glycosyl transferase [Thiomicrospira microaerophila]UQB42397.1 glycosyl transferase [Thiomicrospira microaerophila]